jgi:hypothetical protein
MGRGVEIFVLLVLIVVIIGLGGFVWLNTPKTPVTFEGGTENTENLDFGKNELQFYPNMRYGNASIRYWINSSCPIVRQRDIEEAFSIIERETMLRFVHNNANPEISVFCAKELPEPDEQGYFVAGEGGPTKVINTTKFALILSGAVSLYKAEKCETPNIAIHEVLHALGFEHSNDRNSIMYPVSSCEQRIIKNVKDEIGRLYSMPSDAEIILEKIKATKSGRYINFDISVKNVGLKDLKSASLRVIADNTEVKSFELGDILIGSSKMLNVENLKGPMMFNEVEFSVYTKIDGKDYNKIRMKIQG